MALTADLEYKTQGKTDINKVLAGAADTLYKGAILAAGTDGYVKVAADVANEVPLGICVDQVVAAGANAEEVEIESGRIRLFKRTQHRGTATCGAGGVDNVNYGGKYFVIYNGSTGYYVWFDVANGSVDPAPAGLTGIEVDILAADGVNDVATKLAAAIEAHADFTSSANAAVATITAVERGFTELWGNGNIAACTVVNTRLSGAQQSDIGELFFAVADDGVVYSTEKSNITATIGLCVGIDGQDHLWIDTRIRGV